MTSPSSPSPTPQVSASATHLSYKFQRLREQLRAAIERGELAGRLPGERELARRFHANAKTINKALSDLSADGLVVRHVGRGTFVAGADTSPRRQRAANWWWVSPDADPAAPGVLFQTACMQFGDARPGVGMLSIKPSEMTRGTRPNRLRELRDVAGMVLRGALPDEDVMAELLRRQIPLVLIGAEFETPRVDNVLPDDADAGFQLTEHLLQLGYRRVFVVGDPAKACASERVYTGYHAACKRRHVEPAAMMQSRDADAWAAHGDVGLIAVGRATTQALLTRLESVSPACRAGLACTLEPGDNFAEQHGLSAYEVSGQRVAEWAVRLLRGYRSGNPPVQVVIPGRLIARRSTSPRAVPAPRMAAAPPAEVVI